MIVRGIPTRLAKDAWWMDEERPTGRRMAGPLLLAAIVLADWLVWAPSGGVGFVAWVLAIAGAIHLTLWAEVDRRRAAIAWCVLILALVPAIDLVQPLSVLFAILGLLACAVILVLGQWEASLIVRAMMRLPGVGLLQVVRDALTLRVSIPSRGALHAALFDWALPVGVGIVFIALMVAANPIVDQWLATLGQFETSFSLNIWRVLFWGWAALLVWPLLRLRLMAQVLGRPPKPGTSRWQSGLVNARSVMRALVLFNVIFAVQTLLDLGYLWGGVALPDGMTYATYAHRGAYPLLATGLLAGLFALLSQPFLGARSLLRGLLYLWVAQTVLLVLSSILRLDLYVEAYGLTRLRFAAFVWMGLVALGLILMLMQMVGRKTVGWFSLRAAGLGLIALYACSLVNVDGLLARTNLQRDKPDAYYVCGLGEGAAPAIAAYGPLCHSKTPSVSTPADWREWGYRNARLRRSLAALEVRQ